MRAQIQGQHSIDHLEEKGVERGSATRSSLKSDWNCFKGNETAERQGGAHMGFSERIDTILDWTIPGTLSVELFNQPAFCRFAGSYRRTEEGLSVKRWDNMCSSTLQTLRHVAQSSWSRANSRLKSRSVSLSIVGFWGADGCSCRGGCVSRLTEDPLLSLTPRLGSATDAAPLACERTEVVCSVSRPLTTKRGLWQLNSVASRRYTTVSIARKWNRRKTRFCGIVIRHTALLWITSELRSCVKVEVAVLGSLPVPMSLMVSVVVKEHWTMLRQWSQFVPNATTDTVPEDMKLYIIFESQVGWAGLAWWWGVRLVQKRTMLVPFHASDLSLPQL